MNLKQFRYVLTLADEGSFSRAAETLNIKQPSLSQYIKKVEKEVGMELFDRSGGDVRLTDAGCHSAPKQTKRRAIAKKALHIKKSRTV